MLRFLLDGAPPQTSSGGRGFATTTAFLSALSLASLVGCASPAEEPAAESAAAELNAESVGIVCQTLGEIGQCAVSSLCKTTTEAQCKAKASAIASDPDWANACRSQGNKTACGWQSSFCTWEETSLCVPRAGRPSVGPPNLEVTCQTLGELGSCGRVPVCKAAVEGACRPTDDAIALDPQWEQMCPRAGTNREACEVQGFCMWEDVTTCTPRAAATAPLDLGTACRTLGETGACGRVAACKTLSESRCVAKASALASDPSWADACLRAGHNEQACGWQSSFCNWEPVDQCVPLAGPRPNAQVDIGRACDTFGQLGVCSRAPICRPVASGVCRATANALAGDPEAAGQCALVGANPEACGWLSPLCRWEPITQCVPR
jgi:hypothetical protein